MPKADDVAEIAIVWSPVGVVAAYWNPAIAYAHAQTMAGVSVDVVVVRTQLPEHVRDDLATDFADDDQTPEIAAEPEVDTVVIDVDVADLDE